VDFSHYTDQAVQAAADLVNTRGSVTGNEYLGTPEAVDEFLAAHGFTPSGVVSEEDIAQLHATRDRLRDLFATDDEDQAARLLNELLSDLEVQPLLTDHDGTWHLHYASEDAPLGRRLAATAAMGVASVISMHGFERLGVCSADECKDVYVDTSRNQSRRYCGDTCASRMNVAAYRARHKENAV
jgi:predicted RNA-binding Zn ribbon-like protein